MAGRLDGKAALIIGTAGDQGWMAKGGLTAKCGELERLQSIVRQPA